MAQATALLLDSTVDDSVSTERPGAEQAIMAGELAASLR
jgi:hypothetical protein